MHPTYKTHYRVAEEPTLWSVELLYRARQAGYTGGKSAVSALAHTLRVHVTAPLVRFEGLAGIPPA